KSDAIAICRNASIKITCASPTFSRVFPIFTILRIRTKPRTAAWTCCPDAELFRSGAEAESGEKIERREKRIRQLLFGKETIKPHCQVTKWPDHGPIAGLIHLHTNSASSPSHEPLGLFQQGNEESRSTH
ncbi:unnamed protein product, partial [Nesidiocoris tenuis]